jgi:hypothetical protein
VAQNRGRADVDRLIFFLVFFFFSLRFVGDETDGIGAVSGAREPYLSILQKVQESAEQLQQLPLSDRSNFSLSVTGKNLNGEPASGSGVLAAVSLPLAITLLYDGQCEKYTANNRPGAQHQEASGLLITTLRAHLSGCIRCLVRRQGGRRVIVHGQAFSQGPFLDGDLINRHLWHAGFGQTGPLDSLTHTGVPAVSFRFLFFLYYLQVARPAEVGDRTTPRDGRLELGVRALLISSFCTTRRLRSPRLDGPEAKSLMKLFSCWPAEPSACGSGGFLPP